MKRGLDLDVVVPDNFNISAYYLENNLVEGRGKKTAVYYEDKIYTFEDLFSVTNRMGNVLRELGVGFEDRVLLILQDSPEWLAGWYGAMKMGGIVTHAYTYLLADDYEYFVNYVRPKVVIVDKTTLEAVRQGVRKSLFPDTAILAAGEGFPALKKGEYSLVEMMKRASSDLQTAPTKRNDIAFWNFSGGTTGKPKGVPHMHRDCAFAFESFQHIAKYSADDLVFNVSKLFFTYSRDLGMNWPLHAGAAAALSPERSTAESVFKAIRKFRPTVVLNVPTMMRAMLQSPEAKTADFSFMRMMISSGELLPGPLHEEFVKTFRVEVINSVGSAETFGYFLDTPGEVKWGSSGKLMPLVEIKVVDGEGKEVPKGEVGVLYVRSSACGTHYHGEDEKTKKTFLGNGWVNTNDLVREDEDGYFWYSGRADDLIKVSGVYVSPLEIEKTLGEHEAVHECVVLGVKDADGLDKTKAYVVLRAGYEPSEKTADLLKAFCRQKMAPYKAPRSIEFMDDLPKMGQGKVDKRKLKGDR